MPRLLGRPLVAHVVALCERQGFDPVVVGARELGTAGAVRDAVGPEADDPVVVIPGGVLTDIDLNRLVERHRSAGGLATLAVKQVDDPSGHSIVLHDAGGRVSAIQERPHPDEALSGLADCGIYCVSLEVLHYFPGGGPADWTADVFPALLEHDVPFHVHEIDEYWNAIGSPDDLRRAERDALRVLQPAR